MRRRAGRAARCLLGLAVLFLLLAGRPAVAAISYTLTPRLEGGRLAAFDVTVRVPVRVGVVETFALPALAPKVDPSAASVSGGHLSDMGSGGGAFRVVADAPVLTIRYALPIEAVAGQTASGQRAVLRAAWFSFRGEDVLLKLSDAGSSPATVRFAATPPGWVVATSASDSMTAEALQDTIFIGGLNYRLLRRDVGGATVTFAYPGGLETKASDILYAAAAILKAERRFWRAPPKPFLIGLVQLEDDADFSGRGARGGFSLYLGDMVARADWLRVIAHENLHAWISREIGGFPQSHDDLEAWLNEGFTEAYTPRMLLDAGLWTEADVLDDWNRSLARYDLSPVRTAPNAQIEAERGRDPFVSRLPYDRGRLLALRWDQAMRRRTHGRVGLDQVLRSQVAAAAAQAAAGRSLSADRLLPLVVRQMTGLDLAEDYARFVDRGAPLSFPKGGLGPCIDVRTIRQPAFDRGFDLTATMNNHGRIAGLEPGGPAERAGLRAEDKVLIDETPSTDSRIELSYVVVAADGARHTVRYRPEGRQSVSLQQLVWIRHEPSCRRSMERP